MFKTLLGHCEPRWFSGPGILTMSNTRLKGYADGPVRSAVWSTKQGMANSITYGLSQLQVISTVDPIDNGSSSFLIQSDSEKDYIELSMDRENVIGRHTRGLGLTEDWPDKAFAITKTAPEMFLVRCLRASSIQLRSLISDLAMWGVHEIDRERVIDQNVMHLMGLARHGLPKRGKCPRPLVLNESKAESGFSLLGDHNGYLGGFARDYFRSPRVLQNVLLISISMDSEGYLSLTEIGSDFVYEVEAPDSIYDVIRASLDEYNFRRMTGI